MVAARNWDGIRRFLRFYGGAILAVTIPGCLLLVALSPWIIRIMYQRGAFTAADTNLVVRIQVFYLFRIPFATCGVLATRTLTALRANQVLLYMSFASFALNAGLDYIFMHRYGIAGITLSTTVCSAVVTLCLAMAMYRMLDRRAQEVEP
jgi:putative peptidoglycan lipid II flippase